MATDGDKAGDAENAVSKEKKKKGGMGKIIAIVVGALVLVALSVGVSLYAAKTMLGSGEHGDASGKGAHKAVAPPVYFAFDPAFVVNFEDESAVRFLQITVEVMTRDPLVVEQIKTHTPKIRNNLVMLFSSVKYTEIRTVEGKEALRAKALAEIQSVLKQQTGKAGIEEAYFTGFVVQ